MNNAIRPGCVVSGPTLPERVEVLATAPMGESLKIIGRGQTTGQTYTPILNSAQLARLTILAEQEPFDGDARLSRLGIEAHRLGLAYEYDPFFSLSIARVDPLPHQLEAVYGYFLKLPRIRFLLADDPGAGKTIMAGLLLKELKARGLVRRVLIVTPANLTFQWQRELADKFREKFDVLRGAVLRANYGQNPWQERDQVITSVSWVSVVEDARESLPRSHWDLVIADDTHKMSAPADDRKTCAYQFGEALSQLTDHYLLMTATPHNGDYDHLRRFLSLLDFDVDRSSESLQLAMPNTKRPSCFVRKKLFLPSPIPRPVKSEGSSRSETINQSNPGRTTNDAPKPPPIRPGERIIRWRDQIPTRKWMKLYTKALTRFAAHPFLSLEVTFQIARWRRTMSPSPEPASSSSVCMTLWNRVSGRQVQSSKCPTWSQRLASHDIMSPVATPR